MFKSNWNLIYGASGSIVGWDIMLQAGRSRIRVLMRWIFLIYLSFQPHYGPRFDSASNRNEYQESSWGVKGDRHVRLTTSPPSVSLFYSYKVSFLGSRACVYFQNKWMPHGAPIKILSGDLSDYRRSLDGNLIYWTFLQLVTTLYRSPSNNG
jgi:hypothetical protein